MKNSLNPVLFVLFAFISTLSFGQLKHLELTNLNNSQVKKIKAMQEIEVVTSAGTLEGPLVLVNPSTIQIGTTQLALSTVKCILRKNKKAGVACIALGSVTFCLGAITYSWISIWINYYGKQALAKPIFLMGTGAATFVSGMVLLTQKQSFPNTKYQYQIVQ